mgnify:CR=1 FL=1
MYFDHSSSVPILSNGFVCVIMISQADSVVIEVDMDKAIVKKTLSMAKKYGKPVYGVVANMSIGWSKTASQVPMPSGT